MDENELLAELPRLFVSVDPGVLVGSGPDDCAHVALDETRLAVSTDAFVENSHFLPGDDPAAVARKALAASVSDLAASACRPRWAVVSLCLKKGAAPNWGRAFSLGLAAAASEIGVSVIGGDLVSAPAGTFVSVTVFGEPLPGGPVLRGGGRAGDVLVVTGDLGGSILGRHLSPVPRMAEMRALMDFGRERFGGVVPTAAMDISDGLALDLSRLCRESGVGATIDAVRIPISDAARALAATSGCSALEHALTDGEDFELLVAMPPELWEAFSRYLGTSEAPEGRARFSRIGVLTAGEGLHIVGEDGGVRPLAAQGYQHQW